MKSLLNGRVQLHAGDMLAVLPTLPENSVDSVCCDPPYHLSSISRPRSDLDNYDNGKGNPFARRQASMAGFMGKQWDGGDIAFRPETWAAVLRVLKPGGHLVAFAAPKNAHRMVCAIEDAGFEIRDTLMWLFGSGFPKSLSVGKAIDKARNDKPDVEVVREWLERQRSAAGVTRKAVNEALGLASNGGGLMSSWTTNQTTACVPQWSQWLQLKALLGFSDEMDAEVWRLNGRKGMPGDDWNVIDTRPAGIATGGIYGTFAQRIEINKPTDAARQWEGWGTALKPAYEPICLARKPLSEPSIAANVLRWGTGALNIDGCRVGTDTITVGVREQRFKGTHYANGEEYRPAFVGETQHEGRWPANVIHDGSPEVVGAFPAEAGGQSGGTFKRNGGSALNCAADGSLPSSTPVSRGDSGSAARFFYTAKADSDDRLGSKHPTVKPLDLIQYLCRLITPPKGTVLDCFAGTGTTGEAAWREGFSAILIERELEYLADIERRMSLCLSGPDERSRESIKARLKGKPVDAGPLFEMLA